MTVVEFVICVPPLADVYHPRNVYPLALIVASEAYVEPYVTFIVDFDGVPIPFELNVTVYVFAVLVKFAVIVVADVIVPLDGDQLLIFVVYPVALFGVAVTFVPLLKVSVPPFVVYVVPYGRFKLDVDTVPYDELLLLIVTV